VPFTVTATFNETMYNFISTDVTIGNGTISGFGGTYSWTVNPTAQ